VYRFRGSVAIGIVAVVAMLLAASCSTGSSNDTGSSNSSSVPEAVKANVEKYKGLPSFTAPGPSVDVSKLKGKSMFVIPLVPNPFNESIQNTMRDIAQRVGR
jgi:ribose transport system substrate-binding protein